MKFSLSASIATLIAIPLLAGIPLQAFGEIDPAQVADFAAKDTNRLRGNVVRALVRKSPYIDVLDGGTLESGVSDVQVAVVQERAALHQSLVRPTFTNDLNMCGQTGDSAEVGSKEYTYQLQTNRGKGPLVCIKGMWSAFKMAYSAAEDSMKKQLIQLNNSDVRITLVDRSGCKMVLKAGASFSNMFDGVVQGIDQAFTSVVGNPDSAPNMRVLQYLCRFLREDFLVEPFETGQGEPVMKFMGSQEVIDLLRDDAGVREDHRWIAAGSFNIGKNSLLRYTWEGPYRGIAFGVDPQPLRYDNTKTVNGVANQPDYIEPEIPTLTDNGVGSRPNAAWIRARYEVAVLMGMNSFRKLTPESYTGEGSFRFPAQGVTGDLMWNNLKDNDKNVWQDYGRHYYQFSRAYKPERPHAVCAIAYARNAVEFGLTPVTSSGDWSSTASL